MKTSTTIVIIIALLLLLILAFTPLLDYTSTVKDIDGFGVKDIFGLRTVEEDSNREIDLTAFDGVETREPRPRIVVSMTSIPERINDLKYTVKSILKQSLQPDEIAINIPLKTLKGKEYIIPEWMMRISKVKLYRPEVDLGPATKLLPTLKREHPDTKIMVVDDDVVYPPTLLETLVKVSNRNPNKAVTTYPKRLIYRGLNEPPTAGHGWSWVTAQRLNGLGRSDIVLGVFGFLVKPRFFTDDVFNYDDKPKEAIWVDDIHISGQLWLNGIEIITPQFNPYLLALPVLRQQRTVGLIRTVNSKGNNDNITIAYYWGRGAFQKR